MQLTNARQRIRTLNQAWTKRIFFSYTKAVFWGSGQLTFKGHFELEISPGRLVYCFHCQNNCGSVSLFFLPFLCSQIIKTPF